MERRPVGPEGMGRVCCCSESHQVAGGKDPTAKMSWAGLHINFFFFFNIPSSQVAFHYLKVRCPIFYDKDCLPTF